jgi:hypothetical protein
MSDRILHYTDEEKYELAFNDGIQAAANVICPGCEAGLRLASIRNKPLEFGPPNWEWKNWGKDDEFRNAFGNEYCKLKDELNSLWSQPLHVTLDTPSQKGHISCYAWKILKLKK